MIKEDIDPFNEPSFYASNRVARVIWTIVWSLLFRTSPTSLHVWRACLLRCFGAKVGRGCHVYPSVRIWAPWNLELDDEVGIGNGVTCYSIARISIGKRAVVSQGAHLCTGSHDYNSASFQLIASPIAIEDRAWVASEAFIGPGVTIREGAVVGARAVVTKDVDAWAVVGGNPAKVIGKRMRSGAHA
jgi:putative colanic acid biosynthesis acetyltransferase WcaF